MKACPYCTKEVQDDAVKCKHCGGWFTNDAELRQKQIDQDAQMDKLLNEKKDSLANDIGEHTEYYSISTKKLVLMSVLTFGLYEVYWFYRNWKAVKIQEGRKISPFWRAIFSPIFCYSLFKRIGLAANQKGYPKKPSPGLLTLGYIFVSALYKLPEPFDLLSSLSFLMLLPIAEAIRFNNARVNPQSTDEEKLNRPQIIFLVIGIILWVLTVLGYVFPE